MHASHLLFTLPSQSASSVLSSDYVWWEVVFVDRQYNLVHNFQNWSQAQNKFFQLKRNTVFTIVIVSI